MHILITGANGQLGYALKNTLPEGITITVLDRQRVDLSDLVQLKAVLEAHAPDAIINAAAYTAVDKAESEPELARLINTDAVTVIAEFCQKYSLPLVQVSTDFVFDGTKSSPYVSSDATSPLGVYGQTKYLGEQAALNRCHTSYVVRTGWIYCEHGNNFVKTMLRLGAEREELGVVADQVGTPTYAGHLAQMIWRLLEVGPEKRIYHFSDAGVASWYDLAVAVFEEWKMYQTNFQAPVVRPIATENYPTPAQRPTYSVLDKRATWEDLGIEPVHWRAALRKMLRQYYLLMK